MAGHITLVDRILDLELRVSSLDFWLQLYHVTLTTLRMSHKVFKLTCKMGIESVFIVKTDTSEGIQVKEFCLYDNSKLWGGCHGCV